MARNPEIVVQYTADTSGLNKGLKGVSKSGAAFGKAMRTAGLVAGAAIAGVGAITGKAIKDASNLNESMNAVSVVFGKAAGKVQDFSQTAATQAGLSMREFNELVTPVGASLINVGYSADQAAESSIELTKRAADMASVFNTSVPEALEAIQAGLRGEADPLEKFGVGLNETAVQAKAMSMGLAESTKALTAQDKAQARVALLMEQTNRLQGDFVKTSDGVANSQRIISAEFENISASIGGLLLPIVAKATSAFAGFLGRFGDAPTASGKLRVLLDAARSGLDNLWRFVNDLAPKLWRTLVAELEKIDWERLGRATATEIVTGLKTLQKQIDAVDWAAAGRQIGKDIADAATRFFQGGDWKNVAVQSVKTLTSLWRAEIEFFGAVWNELGRAAVAGLMRGLSALGSKVTEVIGKIPGWIAAGASAAVSGMASLGVSMMQGLANGITSAAGNAASAAVNAVKGALSAAKNAILSHSPSILWAQLGADTIEGYILGITQSTPKLKSKTADAVQAALDAARRVVEAQQETFRSTFDRLGDFAARAFEGRTAKILDRIGKRFDAAIGKWQAYADAATPAEEQLAKIQANEDARARAAAVTAAKAAVASADTEQARVEALEQLRQANLANTIAALEAEAAQQRAAREREAAQQIAALESQRARELQNQTEIRQQRAAALDAQLEDLRDRLAKHPEEYNKIQAQIKKLLSGYGVDYKKAGQDLGEAFANGLRSSAKQVEAAAKHLAQVVARYLPHSPAETGPLARNDFFAGFGKSLAANMLRGTGAVAHAASRLAGAAVVSGSGSLTGPALLSPGATPVEVRVFIGDTELRGIVRTEVVTENNRTAQTLLAGLLA